MAEKLSSELEGSQPHPMLTWTVSKINLLKQKVASIVLVSYTTDDQNSAIFYSRWFRGVLEKIIME